MFVFLIGMPGAGKSYWLKSFAQRLNLPGLDLDICLEKASGKAISEIMLQGDSVFRKKEQQLLFSLLQEYNQAVIATGGGTPCFENNLPRMKKAGIVVYLSLSLNQIMEQLKQTANRRPLLKSDSEDELREKLTKTFQARKAFYEQADLIFDPNHNELEAIIRKIRLLIQQKSKGHV